MLQRQQRQQLPSYSLQKKRIFLEKIKHNELLGLTLACTERMKKMPENKSDKQRVLSYVNGLLYFYGAMDLESLYQAVAEHLEGGLSQQNFQNILNMELEKDDTPYDFIFDDGLYHHCDVEDPHWVLEEQEKRAEIAYRPITEKEVHLVVNKKYPSLWHPAVKKLSQQLQEQFGWTKDDAEAKILFSQSKIKNGMLPIELVEYFLKDLNFDSFDEVQPFINLVNEMANHTPQWILKGWTPHEVFERYEKHALQPLPATPFDFNSQAGEKSTPKIGRNDPCPCGSGKKFKKCCGAAVSAEDETETAPSDKKRPDIGKKPSLDEWRALYEAATAFKKARCWEWMYNDDLFGVMDPETGEVAYCCIMGELGEHYALGAYLGAEGLQSIFDMMDAPHTISPDFLFIQKCLMASFENREDLDEEDRAVIKELGLKFRGKNQWPRFRSYEPGLYPWFLDAWECRFLTHALQQALEVSLRCRNSKAILECDQPRTFLVRVPKKEGNKIIWSDQYLKAPAFVKKYVSFKATDELCLRRLLTSGNRSQSIWEVDTFFAPIPVQDKKNERPYYPKVFLIYDSNKDLILGHELMKDFLQEGHRCINVITDLMGKFKIPSQIVVERDETYFLLKDLCSKLNIPLKKVEQLLSIPQVREEMFSRDW